LADESEGAPLATQTLAIEAVAVYPFLVLAGAAREGINDAVVSAVTCHTRIWAAV
jgi:hypothetical protein